MRRVERSGRGIGGVKDEDRKQQRQLAESQNAVSQEQLALARADRAQRDTLQAPLIGQLQKITSGDRKTQLSAIAPQIGEINRGFAAAKENILSSVPSGAAREFALSQMEREKPAQVATLFNTTYTGGLDKMANLGSGLGAFSLQELSAGLKAGELAGNTRGQIMQQDAQAKAATLGFLGSLAGGAANIATGGMASMGKKGGGGGGSYNPGGFLDS